MQKVDGTLVLDLDCLCKYSSIKDAKKYFIKIMLKCTKEDITKRISYFQFLNNEFLYLNNENLRILMIPNDPQLKILGL